LTLLYQWMAVESYKWFVGYASCNDCKYV